MRRLLRDTDLASVHAIYMHPRVVPFLTHDQMTLEEFATPFAELLSGGNFFVFEREGAIVGFYRLQRGEGRSAHIAHIGMVAVAPEFHGKGVGKAMMQDALAHLEREGALRVELLAISEHSSAIAFYESLGFQREGVQRGTYCRNGRYLDDIMMVQFFGALRGN